MTLSAAVQPSIVRRFHALAFFAILLLGWTCVPGDATLTNGTGTFSAALNTGGSQFVVAEEVGTPSINGISAPIVVAAGSHFSVVAL